MNPSCWGASPDDWFHLTVILGLAEDLLPVVSNPNAAISEYSKISDLGKTPSLYNRDGKVVGFSQWTRNRSTDADITRWEAVRDYGICIQTREVRGLDVDITDADESAAVWATIQRLTGALPRRTRANSPKFLCALRLPGEVGYRRVKTKGGVIEFLAHGKQFIAVGTHPSGLRYEWEAGLPDDIPTLSADEFEALWSLLVAEFGIEDPTVLRATRTGEGGEAVHDDVTEYLEANGWVKDIDRVGKVHITCPWEDQHTSQSETSTSYMPPGLGQFERGHFACLHAHCRGRSDDDFLDAVGYRAADFEDVTVTEPALPKERPRYKRSDKGVIQVTMDNMVMAMRDPAECGMLLGYDAFRDEIMFSEDGGHGWEPFKDADYVRLRIQLERIGFKSPNKEITRDAVLLASELNRFDSAQLWLGRLVWDGVPRVDRFLTDYIKAVEDTPYVRAVARYLWTAAAGRTLSPGVKADMVPVLVGAQGIRKSSAVAAMAPDPQYFCEISLADRDDDLSRKMRGRLIAELGELRGLRGKEREAVKAWVSRQYEDWTPKFREFNTVYPRRLVFIGTTNNDTFLDDVTGNRRWLPVTVASVDVPAIERDRLQMWAEAAHIFRADGIYYRRAEELAEDEHEQYADTDSWDMVVQQWLNMPDGLSDEPPLSRAGLSTHEVLIEALGYTAKGIRRAEEMRMADCLRRLGFTRKRLRVDGARVWLFVKEA